MVLRKLGRYSMDIYIMANAFQVFVRIGFLNKLGVNAFICLIISFLFESSFPIVLSKNIVRKIPLARKLILGSF